MAIRLAAHSDLGAVVEIYNHAVAQRYATGDLDPRTVADQEAWFAAHPADAYPVFVALDGDEVVGWCSLSAYRPGRRAMAHVAEVSYYVHRDARGRGIAASLLRHALAQAPALGKRVLIAIVIDGNEPSLAILRRHGFIPWGFLHGVVDVEGDVRGHVYLGRHL